jgi:cytoskeleton protein RodZ
MATTPVYLLKILENPTIEISQDQLRTLLGEIEAELHESKVYRRAVAMLQKLLGSSTEQANVLFKAIGREAIGLAFRQFVQQYQKLDEKQPQEDSKSEIQPLEKTDSTDVLGGLSQCLTSLNSNQKATLETDTQAHLQSKSQEENLTTKDSVKIKENRPKTTTSFGWLQPGRKRRKAELAKQIAAEQRLESLRQVGQQLRQARESQGLSLGQLHVYTHVQLHHMQAVENGDWDSLPEDVYVRGFVRVMANALGLNGTNLAASLPAPEPVKAILPTSYQYNKSHLGLGLAIRPVHLYVSYAALIAGSVGGLSIMSSEQANADRLINTDAATPPSSSFTKSSEQTKPISKPGLSSSASITVGPDIAPPEAL